MYSGNESLSEDCLDFLRRALTKDPNTRPTATELKEHPWITHNGSMPMDQLGFAPVVVSDEEVSKAVTGVVDYFQLVSKAHRWSTSAKGVVSARHLAEEEHTRELEETCEKAEHEEADAEEEHTKELSTEHVLHPDDVEAELQDNP